jgi:hypothetical protein
MSQFSKTLAKAIAGAAILAAASAAFPAQEARTMLVTATIPGGCTLTTPPMGFGTLNVAAGTDETKVVTATYKCAVGITVTSFTVGASATGTFSGVMTGAGTTPDTIPYTITWTPPAAFDGTGFVTGKSVDLTGTIRGADYIAKRPDNYSQSVTVAINF